MKDEEQIRESWHFSEQHFHFWVLNLSQEDEEEKENSERQLWTGFVHERGFTYRVGDAVFLAPKQPDGGDSERKLAARDDVDENTYPEYYRKSTYVKGLAFKI